MTGLERLPPSFSDRSHSCKVQLAITKPTTLAGVMAIVRYSHDNQYSGTGECLFSGGSWGQIRAVNCQRGLR